MFTYNICVDLAQELTFPSIEDCIRTVAAYSDFVCCSSFLHCRLVNISPKW